MKKSILSIALAATALMSVPAFAADTYKIDPTHSYVGFEISHLGFSTMHGRFDTVDGSFTFDAAEPSKAAVEITVATDSVNTNMAERDNHLRSADILDTANVGQATFKSTSIEVTGEKTARISGTLHILGNEVPLTVDAVHVGGGDDPWGGHRQGFNGRAKLTLKDLGVKMDLGDASSTLDLIVSLEGIRQ